MFNKHSVHILGTKVSPQPLIPSIDLTVAKFSMV